MSKNTNQHIVPKTFLKSWCHNKESLWVYNKNNASYAEINLVNKLFYERFAYNITIQEIDLLDQQYIREQLQNYTFKVNDIVISVDDLIKQPLLFEKATCFDSNGKKLTEQTYDQLLKSFSNDVIDRALQVLENDWQTCLANFSKIKEPGQNYTVSPKEYNKLLFFIKTLYARNPDIFKFHLDYTLSKHTNLKNKIPQKTLFLYSLRELLLNEKSLLDIDAFTPIFLVAAGTQTFICPYTPPNYTNTIIDFYEISLKLSVNAICPISPYITILFVNNPPLEIKQNIIYIKDIETNQVNKIFIDLSKNYFISKNELPDYKLVTETEWRKSYKYKENL